MENIDESAYRIELRPSGGIVTLRIPNPPGDDPATFPAFPSPEPPPGFLTGSWQEQVNLVRANGWGESQEYWYGWFLLHLMAIDRMHMPDPRELRAEGLEATYAWIRDDSGRVDPFTRYYPPDIGGQVGSNLSGIESDYRFGFFLRQSPSDTPTIGAVVAGGPASRALLKRDDRILDLDGLGFDSAKTLIDITASSSHKFRIFRPSSSAILTIAVSTAPVDYPSVWVDTLAGGVGYIGISEFVSTPGSETDILFRDALSEMASLRRNLDAWVLDLRGNGGGTILSSQRIAGQLLGPSTPLMKLRERDIDEGYLRGYSRDTILSAPSDLVRSFPPGRLVFLQNGGTASASEILLSSLRENLADSQFVSYGTTSYGKGIGQIYVESPLGGYFAVTCLHLDPLRSGSYHHKGIAPDFATDKDSILVDALRDILASAQAGRAAFGAIGLRGVGLADSWNRRERLVTKVAPLRESSFPGAIGVY